MNSAPLYPLIGCERLTLVNGGGVWPPSARLTSIVMKALVAVPKSKGTIVPPWAGIVSVINGCGICGTVQIDGHQESQAGRVLDLHAVETWRGQGSGRTPRPWPGVVVIPEL